MTFLLALLIGAATLADPAANTTEPAIANRMLDGFEARLAAGSRATCAWPPSIASWSSRPGATIAASSSSSGWRRTPRGGANRFLNLALANVDKVPVSGSVRRALLGRDALDALTRAIAIEPTDLAYLIRGLVNLYYDQFVFHRTDKGVADLETARQLSAAHPQVRVHAAHSGRARRRLLAAAPARQGARDLARRPRGMARRRRLPRQAERGATQQIPDIIERALDAGVRVDTTLRELFPDLTPTASKAVP